MNMTAILLTAGLVVSAPKVQMLDLVNEDRVEHGEQRVSLVVKANRYALRHSQKMANHKEVFHSTARQIQGALDGLEWALAGEVVGSCDCSLEAIEDAFMLSDKHRREVLRPRYDRVGIGIVKEGDRFWVTVILFG